MSEADGPESRGPVSPGAQPSPLHGLVDAALEGSASAMQVAELRRRWKEDPEALREYVDQVRVHAMIRWRYGQAGSLALPATGPIIRLGSRWMMPLRRWAIAAALALSVAIAAGFMLRSHHNRPGSVPNHAAEDTFAAIAESHDVVWATDIKPLAVGSRLRAGGLAIDSGTLRFQSDIGATVDLVGPARVRIISPLRLEAIRGRVTARVGAAARGFTIDSPRAAVVDLGTEFGVAVGDGGETDVVVFEGKVDVKPKALISSAQPAPTTRMTRGEGVRLTQEGSRRIVAVERRPGGASWSVGESNDPDAVITSVHDNLRSPAGTKYYQIVSRGLAEDAPAYVDRSYEWNGVTAAGIAPELLGADLVMPFNSDKRESDLELIVTLASPAALYVFHEPRHGNVPEWLRRDFVDTGLTIGLDEGPPDMPQLQLGRGPGKSIDRVFHVWRREVRQAGTVTLGENSTESKSMYGIAAAKLK